MKHAVSISLGSSKRDKTVEVELLGEQVRIERIGTDGDLEKIQSLVNELREEITQSSMFDDNHKARSLTSIPL